MNGSRNGGAGGGAAAGAPMENSNSNYYGRKPYLRDPTAVAAGRFIIKTREPAHLLSGNAVTFRFPDGIAPADCIKKLQEFYLFDEEVVNVEPGYYTWMLKKFAREDVLRLVAAPVYSTQEVGTLHVNMDLLTTDGTVWIAGELLIGENPDDRTKTYTYNILSGTYTAKLSDADQAVRKTHLGEYLTLLGVPPSKIYLAGGTGFGPLIETGEGFVVPEHMNDLYTGECGMVVTPFVAPKKKGGSRRRRRRTLKRGRSPPSTRRAR